MEFTKLIKKTLTATAMWFTAILTCYMIILQIINVGDEEVAIQATRVILIALFSLLFSIANVIRASTGIHSVLRFVAHYAITAFAFYACFLLPVNMRASFMFTGLIIFTVAYLITVGIIALFTSRLKANRENEITYTNQFNKKK